MTFYFRLFEVCKDRHTEGVHGPLPRYNVAHPASHGNAMRILVRLVAAVSRPFDAQMVEKHRESADFLQPPRLGAIPQQAS